jgi:hypothetical protein
MRFYDIISGILALGQSPLGKYCGSKTVFGETINGVVNFKSSEILDFAISGDFTINCADEYYSLSGSQVVLRDIGLVGDCTHDALADNKITLDAITYDSAVNTIDVAVKYSIAKIDIMLAPCSGLVDIA